MKARSLAAGNMQRRGLKVRYGRKVGKTTKRVRASKTKLR